MQSTTVSLILAGFVVAYVAAQHSQVVQQHEGGEDTGNHTENHGGQFQSGILRGSIKKLPHVPGQGGQEQSSQLKSSSLHQSIKQIPKGQDQHVQGSPVQQKRSRRDANQESPEEQNGQDANSQDVNNQDVQGSSDQQNENVPVKQWKGLSNQQNDASSQDQQGRSRRHSGKSDGTQDHVGQQSRQFQSGALHPSIRKIPTAQHEKWTS